MKIRSYRLYCELVLQACDLLNALNLNFIKVTQPTATCRPWHGAVFRWRPVSEFLLHAKALTKSSCSCKESQYRQYDLIFLFFKLKFKIYLISRAATSVVQKIIRGNPFKWYVPCLSGDVHIHIVCSHASFIYT